MRSRSFVAVACLLLTTGAALLAYVADDAIRTPGGRGANLLNTLNKLVPEALTSAVNRKLQDFGVDVHQPILTSPVDAVKERINNARRSLMQVGRGGKARGRGGRGRNAGRGGGGRGAQKRLPELEEWVPSYALREHWPSTTGLNSFAGTQPLPERCKGERLRPADVSHKGPNGSPSGECFQLDLRGKNETQPVLPTLFVPGFPKSATTWLWDCMHAAYLPEVVCRDAARNDPRAFRAGFDPRRWSKAGCSDADGTPRRFMLPGTACNVLGGCQHRKELFFYGGGFGNYFANGLASLHGPEVRRRPRRARSGAHFRRKFGAISAQFSPAHTPPRAAPLSSCRSRCLPTARWRRAASTARRTTVSSCDGWGRSAPTRCTPTCRPTGRTRRAASRRRGSRSSGAAAGTTRCGCATAIRSSCGSKLRCRG